MCWSLRCGIGDWTRRSEEHTSELQSHSELVDLYSFPTRRSSDLKGQHDINKIFSIATISVVTVEVILSVVLLIKALLNHEQQPSALLISAGSLWFTNVLVFALWYWRLDAEIGRAHV